MTFQRKTKKKNNNKDPSMKNNKNKDAVFQDSDASDYQSNH